VDFSDFKSGFRDFRPDFRDFRSDLKNFRRDSRNFTSDIKDIRDFTPYLGFKIFQIRFQGLKEPYGVQGFQAKCQRFQVEFQDTCIPDFRSNLPPCNAILEDCTFHTSPMFYISA